ncbi:MAG: hypothetical protein GX801_06580 [Fibrobacter sp.]|nr:hypothetical protein [Fibrobacter sp.]
MIEIIKQQEIPERVRVQNDRQLSLLAILVASIARGRTIIEDFNLTTPMNEFVAWLNHNNFDIKTESHRVYIEGKGFFHHFSPLQQLPQDSWGQYLALILLSQDTETVFQIENKVYPELLAEFSLRENSDNRIAFGPPCFVLQTNKGDEIDPITKVRVMLQALFFEQSLDFYEVKATRDIISGILTWFGAPLTVQNTSEEMDEFSRRLARLQGLKIERKIHTTLQTCKMLTGRDYFVPGDPTEAAAWALLATLVPNSELLIENVLLNNTRTGVFGAFKRMGAEIESTQRRGYGDVYGNIRIKTSKQLTGRRFTNDILNTCLEEIPLLAVAAAFAEGETILRMSASNIKREQIMLDALIKNLKKIEIDLGIYEEGLVIRGNNDIGGTNFEGCREFPVVDMAILVLAGVAHGKSSLNSNQVFNIFPNFFNQSNLAPKEA